MWSDRLLLGFRKKVALVVKTRYTITVAYLWAIRLNPASASTYRRYLSAG